MKKLCCMLGIAMMPLVFSGCLNNGSTASAPSSFTATAGDGRVMLTWTVDPTVQYWVFLATDPSLTAFNWTGLLNGAGYTNAPMPFYACGLYDDTTYYFASNGRTSNGPGGSSSPTVSATPYNASSHWHAGAPITASDFYGVGYLSLTTCSNNATSAAGSFAVVGKAGVIYTSPDGITWTAPANLPAGFNTDLYAVTGYAASLNNPTAPSLRWIAVGAGGASLYSLDGQTWTVGVGPNANTPANPGNNALRAITHSGGTFFAVGDAGTIVSTSDGINWNAQNSTTSSNLLGLAHGSIYVAVGENGTIVTSANGTSWGLVTPVTSSTLRQVATSGSIIVAVGDSGTIVTSINGGGIWTLQPPIPGSPDLVSVTAEAQNPAYDPNGAVIDPVLGTAPNAQFVAIDSNGNAYTSVDGVNWSVPFALNASGLNALVSSGFGYVAAGNAGANAYAF